MPEVDNSGSRPKKKVNFLLIVILAAVAIVIFLVLSFFTIDIKGRKMVPKAHGDNPPSQTMLHPLKSVTQTAV